MNRCFKYLMVVGLIAIVFPAGAQIPADDPAQLIKVLEDFGQNGIAEGLADTHNTYQNATKKIVGIQNAASKLTQKNGLEKALLGKSNVLSGTFKSLGVDYTNPIKAMSNDTLKKLRSELVNPSTDEERMNMTEDALEALAASQAKNFQALSIQSLSEAWVAQTEAAAKAEVLSSIGKDIDSGVTQTDVLISLIRISAETAAELNARTVVQSGNLTGQSIGALRDTK